MSTSISAIQKSLALIACLVSGPLFHTRCAVPQQIVHEVQHAPNVKLTKTVSLMMGSTTVQQFMAALSEQTGLNIKAADYLRDRKIIIQIENESAVAVLNDISELNDWEWSEQSGNTIMVVRRKLQLPANANKIPRYMQSAIPRDIRTFLAVPTPLEDVSKDLIGKYESRFWANVTLTRSIATDQASLLTMLPHEILNGAALPYSKLTPLQRSQLLVALVLPIFKQANCQWLYGDCLPQVTNTNDSVLRLNGNTIDVRTLVNDGSGDTLVMFSAQLK